MSVRITITDAEIDVLYDLEDGDSVSDPADLRYPTLMGLIAKVNRADKRPAQDPDMAIRRHLIATGQTIDTAQAEAVG